MLSIAMYTETFRPSREPSSSSLPSLLSAHLHLTDTSNDKVGGWGENSTTIRR